MAGNVADEQPYGEHSWGEDLTTIAHSIFDMKMYGAECPE